MGKLDDFEACICLIFFSFCRDDGVQWMSIFDFRPLQDDVTSGLIDTSFVTLTGEERCLCPELPTAILPRQTFNFAALYVQEALSRRGSVTAFFRSLFSTLLRTCTVMVSQNWLTSIQVSTVQRSGRRLPFDLT